MKSFNLKFINFAKNCDNSSTLKLSLRHIRSYILCKTDNFDYDMALRWLLLYTYDWVQ